MYKRLILLLPFLLCSAVFFAVELTYADGFDGSKKLPASPVYDITGDERDFAPPSSNKVYNITGNERNEIVKTKKNGLSDFQKAKLEYFEMEENGKISALEKDLQTRKKMRDDEIAKPDCDVYAIDNLTEEIKMLTADIESVLIETKKKIRSIMFSDQYKKYEAKKNKKLKKESRFLIKR